MSDEESILQRRRLLRGGALLAGAAAGAVAVSAAGATKAEAADGDTVTVGNDHTGTDTTNLTIDNQQAPTLGLANGNGPSLRLSPLPNDWECGLDAGEIANTYAGPLIGVSEGPASNPVVTYLATGLDLASLAVPVAYESPDRALDTRSTSGRARVLASSPSPYTTGSRLKAGAYLDVAIGMGDGDFGVSANGLPGPSAPVAQKRQAVRRGSAAVKPQRLMRSRATR
jgi:hypothetical protein